MLTIDIEPATVDSVAVILCTGTALAFLQPLSPQACGYYLLLKIS